MTEPFPHFSKSRRSSNVPDLARRITKKKKRKKKGEKINWNKKERKKEFNQLKNSMTSEQYVLLKEMASKLAGRKSSNLIFSNYNWETLSCVKDSLKHLKDLKHLY